MRNRNRRQRPTSEPEFGSMATFYPFPRLSAPLRARIWGMTVKPRAVDVRVVQKRIPFLPDVPSTYSGLVSYLVSDTPGPATLQACREARNLGLYQKSFSEVLVSKGVERRYVWVDLDIDIISIGTTLFENYLPVASTIHQLKFGREHSYDSFYHFEVREVATLAMSRRTI